MATLLGTDPTPPAPLPAPPKPRRRWPRRALIGVNVFLAVCVLSVGGALGYFRWRLGQIARVDGAPSGCVERGDCALAEPVKGQAFNLLLVGSDTREFVRTKTDQFNFGTEADAGGARSDTMMVLRIDPKGGRAAIVSIPRDLYVDLDGGGKGRINEAFANMKEPNKEDPNRLIRTITKNFGLTINHYMEVDFSGFQKVVDAIGGVTVYFPGPVRDSFSHLNIKQGGCVSLKGDQALAYTRSRHYEYQEGGRWKTDTSSDFGRISRQQDFIRRVLRKAVSQGLTNPIKLNSLADAAIGNIKLDNGLQTGDLVKVATQFRDLSPDKVNMLTLPGDDFTTDAGAKVLRLRQPDADSVLVAFGSKPVGPVTTTTAPKAGSRATTVTVSPATVNLRILNGSGKDNLAGTATNDFRAAGYVVAVTGDADRTTYAQTTIRYGRGQETKARTVLASLTGGGKLEPVTGLKGTDVVVVLGGDYTGVNGVTATGATVAGAPATTIAPPPTTPPAKGTDPSVTC